MKNELQLLDLNEAKALYMKYDGSTFSLWRDDAELYDRFRASVSEDVKQQWLRELLDTHFSMLWQDSEEVWWHHTRIRDLLFGLKTDIGPDVERLLDEMAKMNILDVRQKILVIEAMAGNTDPQRDGGCCLVASRCFHLAERMQAVMAQLMAFSCDERDNTDKLGWEDVPARLQKAKHLYAQAVDRFCTEQPPAPPKQTKHLFVRFFNRFRFH